jgi:hypothetical protein
MVKQAYRAMKRVPPPRFSGFQLLASESLCNPLIPRTA